MATNRKGSKAKAIVLSDKDGAKAATINQASKEIAKSVRAIGPMVHGHMMAIARHVLACGNVTVAANFVNLIVQNNDEGNSVSGVRVKAIKQWLSHFAFVKFETVGATDKEKAKGKVTATLDKAGRKAATEGDNGKAHLLIANREPWNKYTPAPKEEKAWDFLAAMAATIKRLHETAAEKLANSGKEIDGKVQPVNKVTEADLQVLAELAERFPVAVK